MAERRWWMRIDGEPASVARSRAGKTSLAGEVVIALLGGFLLGVGLLGLTESLFGFFIGVGISLPVIAARRP